MTGVVLPGSTLPHNLVLPPNARVREVPLDFHEICGRIAREVEGGDRLRIILHEGVPQPFVIMEAGDDGQEHFVMRTDRLEESVISKLQWMRRVPLQHRLKVIEEQEAKDAAAAKEREHEELYETLGEPMRFQFERDGFIGSRGKSFPKAGVSTRGRFRR